MKYIYLYLILIFLTFSISAGDREKGEKCTADIQCGFGMQCTGGVCTKKPEFDHGSGKSGNECFSDADCIGSGSCARGTYGKKHCTGK
ncbi:hypothetical protein [Leptospira andrefontaineae]|uniref:Prokineticin domain-containing protein n=1 Tax=Leptospira andrefontaineae TaxID=2484976 RepID=A0A4R9HCQ9_9LEPT|nr:hypothetical protein [Leptospira andrefontaineae]TGK44607.1 hypothetical protein EHO65_00795 [Leptospira andrefontaineae]